MIDTTGTYGIRAMLVLARLPSGAYVGTRRIAELAGVPASYLSKLLQTLGRAGLVRSQRGVAGGFSLARDAASISLYEIVNALQSMDRWKGCFLGNAECSDQSACAIHDRWKRVQQGGLGMLRGSTLGELAARVDCLAPDFHLFTDSATAVPAKERDDEPCVA
jgi:Rrf2 family iron-sulfur cluster assembly transcriptional regulator